MGFPQVFAAIFTPDRALQEFAAGALRIYFGGVLIFGAQIACQMTFVSLGKAGCSVIVAVVRKFVLLLPLIYLMPTFMTRIATVCHFINVDKTTAVFTAEPVADIIAVTFTVILFIFQFRRAMRNIQEKR